MGIEQPNKNPLLQLELGPNKYLLEPATLKDLKSWLIREAVPYRTLLHITARPDMHALQRLNQPIQTLGQAHDRVINLPDDGTVNADVLNAVANELAFSFTASGLPILHEFRGAWLDEAIKTNPLQAATAAWILSGRPGTSYTQALPTNDPNVLMGIALGGLLSTPAYALFSKAALETGAKTLEDLHRRFSTWLAQDGIDVENARRRRESELVEVVRAREKAQHDLDEAAAAATANYIKQAESTTADFEAYKRYLKTELALKAPATYWGDKAAHHRKLWYGFGVAALILGVAFAAWAYWKITTIVGTDQITFSPITYGRIATMVVLATLGFWLLKLIVKLALSNLHLSEDASERVVMVRTYLALMEADRTPEADTLLPVLTALFRTAADGIVKDEPVPTLLGEILKSKS